jgi:methyltransferase family protein
MLIDLDSTRSASRWARSRRWKAFARRFQQISEMRVIDLGGTPSSWLRVPVRPLEVVTVNVSRKANVVPDGGEGWIRPMFSDACDLSPEVRAERFDLAFSNSVLEHVGGHARRSAFAESVRSLAPHHWVQTPYRYFPIEPHFLFPGFQLLPLRARAEVAVRWPIGNYARVKSVDEALERAIGIELLSVTELSHYFPDSAIARERVAGLTKSLIAIL